MRGQTVRASDGRTWVVRRRWTPRIGQGSIRDKLGRRFKRSAKHSEKAGDYSMFSAILVDDFAVVVRWIVIVVVATLLIVLAAFAAVVEIVLLVLLLLIGIGSRVLLDRPWIIEAVPDDGERLSWRQTGWRASADRRDQIATLLESGITPPPDAPTS
jgi:hypothetical protein